MSPKTWLIHFPKPIRLYDYFLIALTVKQWNSQLQADTSMLLFPCHLPKEEIIIKKKKKPTNSYIIFISQPEQIQGGPPFARQILVKHTHTNTHPMKANKTPCSHLPPSAPKWQIRSHLWEKNQTTPKRQTANKKPPRPTTVHAQQLHEIPHSYKWCRIRPMPEPAFSDLFFLLEKKKERKKEKSEFLITVLREKEARHAFHPPHILFFFFFWFPFCNWK